ncbi:hypothetical protein JTB14_009886 [Gonioctena quinquepunctata]|nr:hypothetical protein JTB14_009886 [Gonioctena quinquepunctata]
MNLAFKGLYETRFPDSPGVEFSKWMILNVPLMLISMSLSVFWLQFWFMGLLRPNSADAQRIAIGEEGRIAAKNVISSQLEELGRITFHEVCVAICFVLAILLWFFRKPGFIKGWVEYITKTETTDATVAILVVMILFVVPSKPDFIYMFSKDESKRPKAMSESLLTWRIVNQKMPWSMIFLLGGGFTMAEGAKASGMSSMIAGWLKDLASLEKRLVIIIAGSSIALLTQFFSSNIACASIVLPVMADLSVIAHIHPMFVMMPTALCCGYAFCLPVSTPPNAIAALPCNMPAWEMIKAGTPIVIICLAVLFLIFPFYGQLIWDFNTYPEWAV